MAAVTGLDVSAVSGGVRYSCIAATTGHLDQISTSPGRLHAVVVGSIVANGVVSVYDSTTNSTPIAVITVSSALTPEPRHFDFKGVRFDRLTVATSVACNVTILYS